MKKSFDVLYGKSSIGCALIAGALGVLMGVLGFPARADEQENALLTRGHRIAMSVCSACHAVPSAHTPILREQAPDLKSIANKSNTTPESLADFLRSPTHPMPNPQLTDEMINAVTAYTLSLRRRQ
jgi:mono/diheme cytochrome c family protein